MRRELSFLCTSTALLAALLLSHHAHAQTPISSVTGLGSGVLTALENGANTSGGFATSASPTISGTLIGGPSANLNLPWITSWTPTIPVSNPSITSGAPAMQSGLVLQGAAGTNPNYNY